MADRKPAETRERVALCSSVLALLTAGVGNVLLAVTESVLWPLVLGVVWVVVAVAVTAAAEAAAPSRSRTRLVEWVPEVVAAPARPR